MLFKFSVIEIDFTRISRTQNHHLSYSGFSICMVTLYFSFFVLLPSSCFLITLVTLRLIHKTPTSTPNVTFPQLRRDDAPHLPDSSRKSTSRFKKVGIFFFGCLLENGWGNPVETSCFEKLTACVMRKKHYPCLCWNFLVCKPYILGDVSILKVTLSIRQLKEATTNGSALLFGAKRRALTSTLLPHQAIGQALHGRFSGVCHHGHYKALSRCRPVGSCVRLGENFFPGYDYVCTLDTVTGNLEVNSVFITMRSMRDTNKFRFFFSKLFFILLLFPLPW